MPDKYIYNFPAVYMADWPALQVATLWEKKGEEN